MNQVVLQIPVSKNLKSQIENLASRYGESLEKILRKFLTRFIRQETIIKKEPDEYIQLSARAQRRYAKMDEDFRTGKNIYTAHSVAELMRQLKILLLYDIGTHNQVYK